MNSKKRRKQRKKEINKGIKENEKNTGTKYDYYGEVSRRESMKTPKLRKIFNYNKLIRYLLFIIFICSQLRGCFLQ